MRLALKTAGAVVVTAMLSLPGSLAIGENVDSLSYLRLLPTADTASGNNGLIDAAKALAQEGLFADAVELLRELAPERSPGTAAQTSTRWRVSSGSDYYHIEDFDTALMTVDELRDYNRLIETPLSVWSRVRLEKQGNARLLRWNTRPELYCTERKATFDIPVRLSTNSHFFQVEAAAGAEKWFRADGSGESPFLPAHSQPSDMGKGSLRLTKRSDKAGSTAVSWTLPASVTGEHYRRNRPGYESRVEYGFAPAIELRPQALHHSVRALLDCRYQQYYNGADSLDALRLHGRIDGDWRSLRGLVAPSFSFMSDLYASNPVLDAVHRLDGSLRAEYPCAAMVTGRLFFRHVYEREWYHGSAYPMLDGSETSVRPSLRITPVSMFSLEPELSLEERRSADRASNDTSAFGRYLWEPRRSLDPAVRLGILLPAVEASLRAGFRIDDIASVFERYVADSRLFRLATEISASPHPLLSLSLFSDYQYRAYRADGRRAENLTVSGSLNLRLP
ncbi:MAG: hypothetical protein JXA71_00610 [Chitinispirillaceae bacterium]|nr:hypothetical protein [Chitinispirillaceae bacterium]